jgi:hypothetical protein
MLNIVRNILVRIVNWAKQIMSMMQTRSSKRSLAVQGGINVGGVPLEDEENTQIVKQKEKNIRAPNRPQKLSSSGDGVSP